MSKNTGIGIHDFDTLLPKRYFCLRVFFFVFFLQMVFTGCGHKSAEADNQMPEENPPANLDVMDYCGKWDEMLSVLDMELIDRSLGLGNVYEGNGFDLDIGSGKNIELRNGECQNISISGIFLGNNKALAEKKLEQESWLYCNLYMDINCDLYITKRNEEYYYLQLYYSGDDNLVEHWYLYNWSADESIDEACAGYDAFINAEEAWEKEYIRFIMENGMYPASWTNYKLLDINGDDIPELYINSGSTAGGAWICSYYDDMVISTKIWNYGFSYIEGKNLFMDFGGHMDWYHNIIYSIENGEFVIRGAGSFGAADNSKLQYDADGNLIYEYYWNKARIPSEKEYQELLHAVYDEQKASNPYLGAEYDSGKRRYVGNGLCDYNEILEAITDY